jgi:hypothetical protein
LFELCGEEQFERYIEWAQSIKVKEMFGVLGHAIAIGRLEDCFKMQQSDAKDCWVQYKNDLYCHRYADVKPIEPFLWKGYQGWKILGEDIKSKIKIISR